MGRHNHPLFFPSDMRPDRFLGRSGGHGGFQNDRVHAGEILAAAQTFEPDMLIEGEGAAWFFPGSSNKDGNSQLRCDRHDRRKSARTARTTRRKSPGVTRFLNQPWFSIAELEADLKCQLHLPRPDRCHAGQHAEAGIPNCCSAATGRAYAKQGMIQCVLGFKT